jgi:hypothetical protein
MKAPLTFILLILLPSPYDPTARVGCPIRWLAFARIVREWG